MERWGKGWAMNEKGRAVMCKGYVSRDSESRGYEWFPINPYNPVAVPFTRNSRII